METLEKVIAKITVNGKNVTADVSPYLSRLSYADKEEAESDDLTLTFEDTADHWKTDGIPSKATRWRCRSARPTLRWIVDSLR